MTNLDLFKTIRPIPTYYPNTEKANSVLSQIKGDFTMPCHKVKDFVSDLIRPIANFSYIDLHNESNNIQFISDLADNLLDILTQVELYRERQILLNVLPEMFECLITLKKGELSLLYFGCANFKFSADASNVFHWLQSNDTWVYLNTHFANYEFAKLENHIIGKLNLLTNEISFNAGVVQSVGIDECEKIKKEILSSLKNNPNNPFSFFKNKYDVSVKYFLSNLDFIELENIVNYCFENENIYSWVSKSADNFQENNSFLMMMYFLHQNKNKCNLDYISATKANLFFWKNELQQVMGKASRGDLSTFEKFKKIQAIANNSIWDFWAETLKPRNNLKMTLKAEQAILSFRDYDFKALIDFDILKNHERSKDYRGLKKITLSYNEVSRC